MAIVRDRLLHYLSIVTLLPPASSPAAEDQIRLAGSGSTRCSGRVEVYHNNSWGRVCDDDWDLSDAQVVCRQLDCGAAVETTNRAQFGKGTGQIWINNVGCLGNESSLNQCRSDALIKHNCGHGEDAGVVCSVPLLLVVVAPSVVGGLLLLAVVLLLVCLVRKRRSQAEHRSQTVDQEQMFVAAGNQYMEDGEEDDEEDYVNESPRSVRRNSYMDPESGGVNEFAEPSDDDQNDYENVTPNSVEKEGENIYQNG